MSKTLTSIVALVVLAFAASPSFANNPKCNKWKFAAGSKVCKGMSAPYTKPTATPVAPTPVASKPATYPVPELSATAAPISIALVGGLLAFGLERRRKQNKK